MSQSGAVTESEPVVNSVTLAGRVSAAPEGRTLPSGDRIVTFRVVVPREGRRRHASSRQTVDVIECAAWTARLRAVVSRLRPDDRVEVTGALRRRFARNGGALASYVSVELKGCRIVRSTRR